VLGIAWSLWSHGRAGAGSSSARGSGRARSRVRVTRSPRGGRWADLPSARARFVFEAAFLVLVAFGAALAELRPLVIILLMGCAWVLVALIERASFRDAGRVAPDEEAEEELLPVDEPAEPEPAGPGTHSRWPWRRRREPVEEPSPSAAFEARPSRSHVRRVESSEEAEVGVAELDELEAEVSAQPEEAPGPVVTTRPLDLPGLEQPPVSIPEPRPRGALARAARRVVQPPAQPAEPPPPPPAREWNLWDLERLARERAGNAQRDEEWSALFTHLRVFANADGTLPKEFDGLVRESFGELIEAA
jgi:hypothetical protein